MGARQADWVPPDSFDEYRLVKALGRGSTAQVWIAHDTVLDRLVTVKFIAELAAPDGDWRFLTEARAAARVQHPNIVAVYRVGEVGPRPYVISEYVRGCSLADVAWPIAWPRLLEISIDLARGLAAAHRQGVLHGALEPANAIVSETGDVKLRNFELATLLPEVAPLHTRVPRDDEAAATLPGTADDATIAPRASDDALLRSWSPRTRTDEAATASASRRTFEPWPSVTHAGAVMGTPAYMPPEAWRGEPATMRSDVYALGALLYALAAGAPPQRSAPAEAVRRSAPGRDALPLTIVAPGIDPGFGAVVDRCLRRDPTERFASADAVRDALEALAARDDAAARRLVPPSWRRPLRARWAVVGGVALALAVFASRRFGGEPSRPSASMMRGAAWSGRCLDGMIRVSAATFRMGRAEGAGDADEQPQREVRLSAYCIDTTEVTVAAYAVCVAAGSCPAAARMTNWSSISEVEAKRLSRLCNGVNRPNHPINCVDWEQAAAYCTWNGKRLPTEAEWEYAARGHDGRVYPWGNAAPSANRLRAYASDGGEENRDVNELAGGRYGDADDGWPATAPVGSRPDGRSPLGVLDMAGNVAEWTADWYGSYATLPETDPRGPGAGTSRVARGGGWESRDTKVRAANRDWPDPMLRTSDLGFRCGRSLSYSPLQAAARAIDQPGDQPGTQPGK